MIKSTINTTDTVIKAMTEQADNAGKKTVMNREDAAQKISQTAEKKARITTPPCEMMKLADALYDMIYYAKHTMNSIIRASCNNV